MFQAARFGAVGLTATVAHVLAVLAMVKFTAMPSLSANLGGLLVAILVTYAGNHKWTFECEGMHARYFPRFVAVAALALAFGQVIIWAVTERAGGDYRVAIAVVALTTPAFGFVACRDFVFAESDEVAGKARN
ncbi:MAG TPA: GtrA family protein [Alphaproteobacteria bacterium]|nr:GtrA family protein [Alphaproteobacteria bacterium]